MGVVARPFTMPNGIVETSVYRRVRSAVTACLDSGRPSVIRGPAGIGKTTALHDIHWKDPNAVLINASGRYKHLKQMMLLIAEALDIWVHERSSYDIYRIIDNGVADRAREGRYLIIDEAHRMHLDALREIFDLWENQGLPIILCGNNDVIKKTRTHASTFDQVSSRVGKEVSLKVMEPKDFVLLGAERGVEGMDAYDAITNYGIRTSMREVAYLLDTARRIVGTSGSIRITHIHSAAEYMFGSKSARQVLAAA